MEMVVIGTMTLIEVFSHQRKLENSMSKEES